MQASIFASLGEEYLEYLRDESRISGSATSICFPTSEEQICQAISECRENGDKVTIQGARTGLAASAVPNGGCVINLSKMNHVLGMRKENGIYYLQLESGVVLSELRKMIARKKFDTAAWSDSSKQVYSMFLKDHAFFFSPDPTETSATIGGMVACNASGARSYLYGSTRNHISAVRFITSEAKRLTVKRGEQFANGLSARFICEDGSKIVVPIPSYSMPETKNASGYYAKENMDLIDLLIGSDGTLGVFSQIEISLLPYPNVVWGISCLLESERQALQFVRETRTQSLPIASIEYFDADALQILRDQRKNGAAFSGLPAIDSTVRAIVYTELHCAAEEEALQGIHVLSTCLKNVGANENNSWVARTESDLDRLLFLRHAVPESVNMLIDQRRKTDPTISKLGSDMSVPDACLEQVVELYRTSLKENQLESAIWGHIGNNHLHVNVLPKNAEEYQSAKAMFKNWARIVSQMGGAVSAEHGVGKLKADFLVEMYGQEGIRQMRECKYALDSERMLGIGSLFSEKE